METRPAKMVRGAPRSWRMLPAGLARWMGREPGTEFRSEDKEIAISITGLPERYVDRVGGIVVYVSGDPDEFGAQVPVGRINEPAREVFAMVAEEYDELCDRLFADDPVFNYGSDEDLGLQ